MNEIYPDKAYRKVLEVFCITEGTGEFFDLSAKPIRRELYCWNAEEKIRKDTLWKTSV